MNITIRSVKANELYKGYNKKVIEYMQCVIDSISEQYGKVPDYFNVTLGLLADQLESYIDADKAMKEVAKGFSTDKALFSIQHKLFNIRETSFEKAQKVMSNFSLSPLLKSKIAKLSSKTDDTLSSSEVLAGLLD